MRCWYNHTISVGFTITSVRKAPVFPSTSSILWSAWSRWAEAMFSRSLHGLRRRQLVDEGPHAAALPPSLYLKTKTASSLLRGLYGYARSGTNLIISHTEIWLTDPLIILPVSAVNFVGHSNPLYLSVAAEWGNGLVPLICPRGWFRPIWTWLSVCVCPVLCESPCGHRSIHDQYVYWTKWAYIYGNSLAFVTAVV